jgi:hypothetical protein
VRQSGIKVSLVASGGWQVLQCSRRRGQQAREVCKSGAVLCWPCQVPSTAAMLCVPGKQPTATSTSCTKYAFRLKHPCEFHATRKALERPITTRYGQAYLTNPTWNGALCLPARHDHVPVTRFGQGCSSIRSPTA